MKRLLLDFLWSELHSLGAFGRSEDTAREAAGLLPMYDAWFAESVRVLEAEGYLERRDGWIESCATRSYRSHDELWRNWTDETLGWRRNPDLAAVHTLVETVLRELPDILTGRQRATDVMFPGGSLTLVEEVYKSNPESTFFNRVLADELVAHLQRRADTEPGFEPRILEIGAGTGATSALVLDAIRAQEITVREYCYTDLSLAFLDHAERSYQPTSPFLTTRILNIEYPLAEQGLSVCSFDVVIAANVLHATRNIRTTVRNAKAALKPGGLLLLNEATANTLINHVTFGLLDGWWRYEDAELRIPGCPLLSVETWQRVLIDEGCESVALPAAQAADLGQQIIATMNNGVVPQPNPSLIGDPPSLPGPTQTLASESLSDGSNSASTPKTRLLAQVEELAREVLAQLLRIDRARISRSEAFSSYGLDSIFAVQVSRELGTRLDLQLDVTLLFEYSTLADLGEFLVDEYPTELRAVLGPEERSRSDTSTQTAQCPAPVGPTSSAEHEGMAIVGMSARLPQADDIGEFWRIVEQGERCITGPPMQRADWELQSSTEDTTGLWGGFMKGIHDFDPLFFGISMTEARQVTPELRLMLMAAWHVIEDAGYRLSDLRARPTGVFVATTGSEYESVASDAGGGPNLLASPTPALIPNRISYLFDLRGPSEQCDTTCSSSLVALHRAIRSIREGECDQALVGGVNLIMSPARFGGMKAAGMLSASGQVRPFQQDAVGTARSEGVGAVLIKPLNRALEDGDTVYAVVRGTGVAHGGRGVSFTAPNIRGMKSAVLRAFDDAGVDPGTISYIEAHGMSSPLVDRAEIAALSDGLRSETESVVNVGSVKPCIGHTEVFSGLAALVKTVLVMRTGVIPAIPGFGRVHEDISLAESRLRPTTKNTPWPDRTDDAGRLLPRRAGINSFGIGGVNAHAVLEYHIPERDEMGLPAAQLLVLSARTKNALREQAMRLADWLRKADNVDWANVAFTLQIGREPMERRLALVAATCDEAAEALTNWLDNDPVRQAGVAVTDEARDVWSGDAELLRSHMAQRNLDLLAEHWVAGAPVDWSMLHSGVDRRRIPLPLYPFEKRDCFDRSALDRPVHAARTQESEPTQESEEFVTDLVASVLGLDKQEIDRGKSLSDYGLNSLLLVAMLGRIRGAFPAFHPDWLRPDDTLDDVVARLSNLPLPDHRPAVSRFSELVHLNGVTEGRPVFWIHGALASVESYRTIAAKISRPFFGIQARGFMTEDAPIEGITNMAEYYTEIIRVVQPDGPYDIGGFCLGGIVGYEITRLLQSQGQIVNSLTMVDSPDNTGWARSNESGSQSAQSAALQVVNSLLWPAGEKSLEIVGARLIHQSEIADSLDLTPFVWRLTELAAERKLAMGREQLARFIQRNIRVQMSYQISEYEILPLSRPEAVSCTYFRNRCGLFLGDLRPYFQIIGDTFSLDQVDYLRDWERELPRLRILDLDAANHMTILHDDQSLAVIEQVCVNTYNSD